jgi:hypothetical protein
MLDDLQDPAAMGPDPGGQCRPRIAPIGPDPAQPRQLRLRRAQHRLSPGAVTDIGGGHDHHQPQPEGIDQQVAFAPGELLGPVLTALPRLVGHFDTLAIQDRGARRSAAPGGAAHLAAQRVMDALPGAVARPKPKVVVDGGPGWQIMGQHAPGAAGARPVQDAVDDLAALIVDRPPIGRRGGHPRFEDAPLGIG